MKKRVLAALLAASMALCAGCGSQTSDDGEEQTAAGRGFEVEVVFLLEFCSFFCFMG